MAEYKEESAERMTLKGYAAHRGVSETAVRKACKRHGIPIDTATMPYTINASVADRLWAASVTQLPNAGVRGGGVHPAAAQAAGSLMRMANHLDAKDRKEAALAGMAELRLAQAEGRLVDVAVAAKAGSTALRVLRDRVLMVPVRVAAEAAAMTDAKAVQALIERELRVALDAGAAAIERVAADLAAGDAAADEDEVAA